MFGFAGSGKGDPKTPRGYRAYAVGDVHGRLDLLDRILLQIEQDIQGRPPAKSLIVFLGDLIDRGSESCQVVERLRTYRPKCAQPVFLAGNHEEVLLRLLTGERGILDSWLKYGGKECLQSYGFDPTQLLGRSEGSALPMIKSAIPESHVRFISSFADTLRFGDYLFVHAGIRPKVDLSLQTQSDLRWIRSGFLDEECDHGFVVVHGHTITKSIDERSNRIGIDTGAYRTGVLSALAVEGTDRWRFDTSGVGAPLLCGQPIDNMEFDG